MKYDIDTTTDTLSSTAGMALAGKIFEKIGLDLGSHGTISTQTKQALKIMAGLMVQGRTSFAEVDLVRQDMLFKQTMELDSVYAPESVRIYLDNQAKQGSQRVLTALETVNFNALKSVTMSPVTTSMGRYLPVDIDVSPMDNSGSKKEGVGWTYKGYEGYAPIFSYIGREGYMLHCQLRPGTQHSQKQTPEYLEKNLTLLKRLAPSDPVLIRMDSGNDAVDTMVPLMRSGHFFLVKRNLRREPRQRWVDLAEAIGTCEQPREGKLVYTGVLTGSHPKATSEDHVPDLDQVFRVTKRWIDRAGTHLLFPEVEVEVYWTNLYEDPQTVIELYHDHGTSEQFHSELKTDMNVERFPSGKFAVNAMLLHVAMVVFNVLRHIGQTALRFTDHLPYRHKGQRKRLGKVISDLIRVSCKLVHHAQQWTLRLWEHDPWLAVFKQMYQTI
ncbi:MAG: IS1380 family transposase [Pseudomonadales bacterium]|jgi:hypothetical protein|nr:IS1380 family transposase [Pseudomonadales bacterium]